MVMVKSPRSVRFSWLHPQLVIIFQETSKLFLDLPKTSSVFPQISWGKSWKITSHGGTKTETQQLSNSRFFQTPHLWLNAVAAGILHADLWTFETCGALLACCQALAVRYGNGWSHWNNDEQCQAQLTG